MNLNIQSISYIKYIKVYSVYNTCLHLKPPILILAYYLTFTYISHAYTEFIRLAAVNGMDVFRIFDCFNIVANMQGKGQNYDYH